jgi:transposase
MSFITGFDRKQTALFPQAIDELIAPNNPIRFIDTFVDQLKIVEFGFKDVSKNVNGRPPFNPSDLLKLYIYGYMNKIRSSRGLEKECKRNIELMWLLKGLVPDHNTISNFRKDNPKAIKKVFRATVQIAQNLNLIGGVLLAGDGTKLRAQNSKKNNYNERKIGKHLAYIENKLNEYNNALSTADGDTKEAIEKKIIKHQKHKARYQAIDKKLIETGEKQISTSDPDSRQIMVRGVINEVAYNVQSTVDAKHKLPIDYEVTNQNDKNAMCNMVKSAIAILGTNTFDAVFDKGYHNAEEIHKCHLLGVETHVAIPKPASNAPDTDFNLSNFIHNPLNDSYTCPAKQTLTTNGNWYLKRVYRVKQYKTKHCKICTLRAQCTKSKSGRIIESHEFAGALERNKKAIKERPEIYKQRQALVEHPFGTMKRQWGFDHIMTKKSMKHASADVGFIFLAYNLKRILNIIGIEELLALLRHFIDDISSIFTLKTYKNPNKWSLTYLSIFISSLQFPAFKPYIHKQINYQGGF